MENDKQGDDSGKSTQTLIPCWMPKLLPPKSSVRVGLPQPKETILIVAMCSVHHIIACVQIQLTPA